MRFLLEVLLSSRIAIFGGTFDPIHNAHLEAAREAADQFELDRVLFVPAANPPHKADTSTPFHHRFRMVELAVQHDPRFEVSDLEKGREKSYSILTIERVKAQLQPADELFFLIGADAFAEIGDWFRSADVIAAVGFIVATRPGHEYRAPSGARVSRLDTLALPVSSSEIRQELARGAGLDELPPPVALYIRDHGLYSEVG